MMPPPARLVGLSLVLVALSTPAALAETCTVTSSTSSEDLCTVHHHTHHAVCSLDNSTAPISARDCDAVTCQSCQGALISNVRHVQCQACSGVTISNVPSGGQIDCGVAASTTTGSDLPSAVCDNATISSNGAFTMTCVGDSPVACRKSRVTNPQGSIFCFAGKSEPPQSHACQELAMESVGCLICGSIRSCQGVAMQGSPVPSDQVYVHKDCTDSQVLEYLNRIHPYAGTPCQDEDGNGVCDVVETHCTNHDNPTDCTSKFKAEWAILTAPPQGNATTTSNNDDDKNGSESWIVGVILVGFFVLATGFCVGNKNQWWKQCCGQDKNNNSGLMIKLNSLHPTDPLFSEIDQKLKQRETSRSSSIGSQPSVVPILLDGEILQPASGQDDDKPKDEEDV